MGVFRLKWYKKSLDQTPEAFETGDLPTSLLRLIKFLRKASDSFFLADFFSLCLVSFLFSLFGLGLLIILYQLQIVLNTGWHKRHS
jgi:hypothetical protein